MPDPANDRVLIYNSVSGTGPAGQPRQVREPLPGAPFNREDIVEVPLYDPASARVIGSFALGQMLARRRRSGCHDMGVILGR